jgi:hypothetical protein
MKPSNREHVCRVLQQVDYYEIDMSGEQTEIQTERAPYLCAQRENLVCL